ncbi:MAG: tol-pal system-associated acyl-CoA thioesterase [Dongiaceae bacterium]
MHESLWTSPSDAPIHRHPVRVYIEDTDSGGIVYYANYLRFAERARTEMLRSVGISHAEMMENGFALAVRRCEIDYLRPARLDDDLTVETRLLEMSGASIDLAQRISCDGVDLVRLRVKIACLNRAGRATRLPDACRAALNRVPAAAGTEER